MYFFYASTPHQPLVWQLSLIGIAWWCSTFFAWQFIRQLSSDELDFDGVHWYVGEKIGTLSVRFDAQNYMLVRFEDDLKNANWFWLEAGSDESHELSHWHDLRRAVYSRPATQNSPDLI